MVFPFALFSDSGSILKCQARLFPDPKDPQVNFFIDNWMLIAVALSSAAMLLWPTLSGGGPGGLTADGAVQLINREKAVVIDVCEAREYAAGHVAGSKNIPFSQLENKLTATVKNKSVPLILVCHSGARSSRAVSIAKKLGYEKAFSLSGGINAWRSANLPVERA
jgi:rhodanese-related sulfurtransferase